MKTLTLKRVCSKSLGTFGVLIDEYPFAVTCEPPKGKCMPKGRYICKPFTRPTGVKTFEITGVKGHTLVLFHSGNTMRDTKLCVIVAEEFCDIQTPGGPLPGVLRRAGWEEFMRRYGNEKSFILGVV
jgi:hypothetical protein